jgi:hypothetical protein
MKTTSKDVLNAYNDILSRLRQTEEQIKSRAGKVTVEELKGYLSLSAEFERSQKNIPDGKLKTVKAFLKLRLIWVKGLIKKCLPLFKAAKILMRFFPERIKKHLRGLKIPWEEHESPQNAAANCLICGGGISVCFKKTQKFKGITHTIAYCQDCDFYFTYPLPSDDVLSEFYTNNFNYQWYKDYTEYKSLDAEERRKELKEYLASPVLDYGGGMGYFAERCRKNGYTAELYDPYTLNELSYIKYRTICCFHVLEHSNNPQKFLKTVKGFLEKNGKLIIAVPNAGGIGYRQDFYGWVWSQPPITHIMHFSEKSLSMLLVKMGFEIEQVIYNDRWDANYVADVLLKERTAYFGDRAHAGNKKLRKESVEMDGDYRNLCNKISSLIKTDDRERAELMIIAKLDAESYKG